MDRLNFRYPEQMKPLSQVVAWSILITLVFGIGAFYASKASAAKEAELWAVAHELIPVAEQYMGRPASGALPDMRIVEADEMPCLCAAVYVYAVDVQPAELGYQQPAELLLRKDMRLDQPLDRSIVLHELIHYLQELAGGPVAYWDSAIDCSRARGLP